MAHDTGRTVATYAGITGVKRFRRQKFTGLQILQVEVLHRIEHFQHGELRRLTWGVEWQDANDMQAAQIALGASFEKPGKTIASIDAEGKCFDGAGNVIAYRRPDGIRWVTDDPVPYQKEAESTGDIRGGNRNCMHDWASAGDEAPFGWSMCRKCRALNSNGMPPPRKP